MKRLVLSLIFLVGSLTPSIALAQGEPPSIPDVIAEQAGVGEAGPRFDTGGHILSTGELITTVVQDASVMWTSVFEAAGQSFVPPTVVLVETGSYARSSCGINAGDPAEYDRLTPVLYCQYGGEVGLQRLDLSEVFETRFIYSPVIYLSVPWLEGYARESGAPADVAIAYRVMHEYSRHVARALGLTNHRGEAASDLTDVDVELLVNCLSGVWAWSAYDQGELDPADLDAVQGAAWGENASSLERFGLEGEFGTPEEQHNAFMTGYESGRPAGCMGVVTGA